MESQIWRVYLDLGFDHILDLNGYDHILFVTTLCAIYTFKDWKKILLLVTAFTLGHSLTLALAALDVVDFNPDLIETLIPVTIILTGLYQIWRTLRPELTGGNMAVSYTLTTIFGLIHGLGFSNYFRAILGKEDSIVQPLFAFNIGVEVGQLIIVTLSLMIGTIMVQMMRIPQKTWTLILSFFCTVLAFYLLFR
ncbi:MAG: HupE/UreJ family protein [Saprospiraceae bacterium]|nr:HupE/UreJ family protein [Saprospiraceae bacterium]